jgi:hypothetical protein
MSGVILGPPNYHDYQNQLRKLHAERFSKMPFDVFKSRVKIVKDEAVVKKWIEDLSFKTEYVCLNVPEPLKLASFEDVEKHFRSTHKETIIKPVEMLIVDGTKSRNLRSRELQRLIRIDWENQKHFPQQLATALSKQFASHGLQFFKVNKKVVHVSVARPQFLDLETTPVSENIKHIVQFIDANSRCSRRKLIEALAPTPRAASPAPAAEGEAAPKPAQPSGPTPEQTVLIADLHWLIHQGHVLEFADGRLETAKKPLLRPPKSEAKPAGHAAAAPAGGTSAEAKPTGETKPAEVAAGEETEPAEENPADVTAAGPIQAEPTLGQTVPVEAPPVEEAPSPS